MKKIKLKLKDLKSPWITPGIKLTSKRKQRFYNTLLKNKTPKNERKYKDYNKTSLKQLKTTQETFLLF